MEQNDTNDTDVTQRAIRERLAAERDVRRAKSRGKVSRMLRMTPEERERSWHDEKLALRQETVGDKNLVAMALADPESLGRPLKAALLDAPLWPGYETKFARLLPGCKLTGRHGFERLASSPEDAPQALNTSIACKFMLCDMRVSPFVEGDPVARVEAAYEEQLRLEQENAPLERARELVRSPEKKLARFNARAILREFEAAAERGDEPQPDAQGIWDRIGPKHPAWVTDIAQGGEDYGFAILTTREATVRPRVAVDRWKSVFYECDRDDNLGGFRAHPRVYGGEGLRPHMNPVWIAPSDLGENEVLSEHDPDELRGLFKQSIASESLPNKKYQRNTLLVLTNDCIFSELDTKEVILKNEDYEYAPAAPPNENPEIQITHGRELPTFFLWAYDADWAPPGEGARADKDGYQGRVKIGLQSLLSWFYYARMTGVDMKALWRRSLELKDQVWTCEEDTLRPGHPERLV